MSAGKVRTAQSSTGELGKNWDGVGRAGMWQDLPSSCFKGPDQGGEGSAGQKGVLELTEQKGSIPKKCVHGQKKKRSNLFFMLQ